MGRRRGSRFSAFGKKNRHGSVEKEHAERSSAPVITIDVDSLRRSGGDMYATGAGPRSRANSRASEGELQMGSNPESPRFGVRVSSKGNTLKGKFESIKGALSKAASRKSAASRPVSVFEHVRGLKDREQRLVSATHSYQGRPVMAGVFALDHLHEFTDEQSELPARYQTLQDLEVPGGVVTAVSSSDNSVGVVSQTGELYVAGAHALHPSTLGQEEGSEAREGEGGDFRLYRVRGTGGLERVALGATHCAAVAASNQLFMWGLNVKEPRWLDHDPTLGVTASDVLTGQLGLSVDTARSSLPVVVEGVTGRITDVAVGEAHTVLVTERAVYSCGDPMTLGRAEEHYDVLRALPAFEGITVRRVSCGAAHSLALTNMGTVFSWGLNDHGQLGVGREVKLLSEPTRVPDSNMVTAVAAGSHHSCAVTMNGMLINWGSNTFGELGGGAVEDRVWEPRLVEELSALFVTHVSCAKHRSFVSGDTGEVYHAGRFCGKVGDARGKFAPVHIGKKDLYVGDVACGEAHAVYLVDYALSNLLETLLSAGLDASPASTKSLGKRVLKAMQVAVSQGSGHLISGVQTRVARLVHERKKNRPLFSCNRSFYQVPMTRASPTSVQLLRVTNRWGHKIEVCGVEYDAGPFGISLSFSPLTVELDPGESDFMRITVTVGAEAEAREHHVVAKLRGYKARSRGNRTDSLKHMAFHYVMMEVAVARDEASRVRDPAKVQLLCDNMATYVPRIILRECLADPTPPAGPSKLVFPAAILFIDISGFTALNERLAKLGAAGPEQVSVHLNRYFGQLIDCVYDHGGDVLKFAGDALLCMFGDASLEHSQQQLTLRAVQCGAEIQERLGEYDSREGFALTVHIAVAAGDINAIQCGGVMGRYEHVVIGEPLLQLETAVDASKKGEVLLSGAAYDQVRECVRAEPRGPDYLLLGVTQPAPRTPNLAISVSTEAEDALRCFLPKGVQAGIDSLHMSYISELRRVTVLFVKLPSLAYERGKPLKLLEINQVLMQMQSVIFKYEGMVRQFLVDDKGTVLIAAFGVPPFSHEDDPVRGLRSALEIHRTLSLQEVTCHVGVTTGKAFCGNVGSAKRQEYAMVGDFVNLSARLMGVASTQGLPVISDAATQELAHDLVVLEPLKPVKVKGKVEPVAIFNVAAMRDLEEEAELQQREGNQEQQSEVEAELVGRNTEVAMLKLQVARLQHQLGEAPARLFVLQGLPGIGKTRVLRELMRECRRLDVDYFFAACDSVEKTTPFFVFQAVLEQLLNLDFWKQRGQKLSRAERRKMYQNEWSSVPAVAKALLLDPKGNWVEYLPLLNAVLPLNIPENELSIKLTGQKRVDFTCALLKYLLTKRARQSPVVLILDDLQWVDAPSIQVLTELAKETHNGVLTILSQRNPPDHSKKWKTLLQNSSVEQMQLEPLSDAQCVRLACLTMGFDDSECLAQMRDVILKAHGNPLFAIEIALALRDSGSLVIEDGHLISVSDNLQSKLPETVEGMIGGRLDQLSNSLQLLLKIASVVGQEFHAKIMRTVYPIPSERDQVDKMLRELVQLGFLDTPHSNSTVFSFKNETIREVTYSRLLFMQRKQMHETVALYFEEVGQDFLTEKMKGRPEWKGTLQQLQYHWTEALLGNPEASEEQMSKLAHYLEELSGAALDEDQYAEAQQYVDTSERLANAMPDSMDAEKERVLYDVARKRAALKEYGGLSQK